MIVHEYMGCYAFTNRSLGLNDFIFVEASLRIGFSGGQLNGKDEQYILLHCSYSVIQSQYSTNVTHATSDLDRKLWDAK